MTNIYSISCKSDCIDFHSLVCIKLISVLKFETVNVLVINVLGLYFPYICDVTCQSQRGDGAAGKRAIRHVHVQKWEATYRALEHFCATEKYPEATFKLFCGKLLLQ